MLSLISSSINQGATIYVGLVVFGVRNTVMQGLLIIAT